MSRYMFDSIVTPAISGLTNAAVLESLLAHNITNAAGDTSVANLTPTVPYHGVWTSYVDGQGQRVSVFVGARWWLWGCLFSA